VVKDQPKQHRLFGLRRLRIAAADEAGAADRSAATILFLNVGAGCLPRALVVGAKAR
jgi:hypothetical protein